MLDLVSLSCHGCKNGFSQFYNNTDRRPCMGTCGHTACTKCVTAEPRMRCRVCHVANAFKERVINYGVEGIIQSFHDGCIEVYRKWWTGEDSYRGYCSNCVSTSNDLTLTDNLRICRQCHNHLFGTDQNIFHIEGEISGGYLRCSNCCLDNPCAHLNSDNLRIQSIPNFNTEVRRFTGYIVRRLLNEQLEEWAELDTCQLSRMRIKRICEVLNEFVCFLHPNILPEYKIVIVNDDALDYFLSNACKFFEPVIFDPSKSSFGLELLDTLKFQVEQTRAPCKCSKLWEKMHQKTLGNIVEEHFTKIIMDTPWNQKVEKCLLEQRPVEHACIQRVLEHIEHNFPFKSHLLPSVYCWNKYRGGMCGLFDATLHKPCMCRRCSNSTCLHCIRDNYRLKCSVCRVKFHREAWTGRRQRVEREYDYDEQVIELVDFYKRNAVDVFKEWWNSESNGSGYCLSCRSYSEQLEICVLCEMAHPESTIKRTGSNLDFFWSPGAHHLPVALQCSGCSIRLSSARELTNSFIPSELDRVELEVYRGCRHGAGGCFKYEKERLFEEPFVRSIVKVRDIGKSQWIVKWSMLEVVVKVLRGAGSEEVLNELERKAREFFEKVLGDEEEEDVEILKMEIDNCIDLLEN